MDLKSIHHSICWICDISSTKGSSPTTSMEALKKAAKELIYKTFRFNGKTPSKALWCKENTLVYWRVSLQTYPGKQPSSTSLEEHSNSCWTPSWILCPQMTISPGGTRDSKACALCGRAEYLSHAPNSCPYMLEQGRYTWRHDNILSSMKHSLKIGISDAGTPQPDIDLNVEISL